MMTLGRWKREQTLIYIVSVSNPFDKKGYSKNNTDPNDVELKF